MGWEKYYKQLYYPVLYFRRTSTKFGSTVVLSFGVGVGRWVKQRNSIKNRIYYQLSHNRNIPSLEREIYDERELILQSSTMNVVSQSANQSVAIGLGVSDALWNEKKLWSGLVCLSLAVVVSTQQQHHNVAVHRAPHVYLQQTLSHIDANNNCMSDSPHNRNSTDRKSNEYLMLCMEYFVRSFISQ